MSLYWPSSKTAEAGGEEGTPSSQIRSVQISAVDKINATITQIQKKKKKTHSSSLLCMIHSTFLVLQFPLLLVDMKSLRTNTEVGIIVQKFSSMCMKEQQQQHADASCVYRRSVVLLTREQSREE